MTTFTRREMFRLAMALPITGVFTRFNPLVAAERNKVKITDIKAMQINRIAGNCLIKIETDAGIVGYGEAGVTGPMARARIATMKPLLVGKDPLAIEVHFQNLTSLMHTYGYIEPMAASNPPEVRKSYLKVPTGPGLGFEINPDFL